MTRRIVRYAESGEARVGLWSPESVRPLPIRTIGALLELRRDQIREVVNAAGEPMRSIRLLPPIDGLTEVWASGVTYLRSSEARQEESQVGDVYSRLYDAARPELFLKSVAWRVCGDGEPIGIRDDSHINVPEPELALVCNSHGEVVGATVCNDVSSRSIEGENPLYLPQAKVYSGSCALGPGIVPSWTIDDLRALNIDVSVTRGGQVVWSGATNTSQLRRNLDELVSYLFRANSFPQGAVLSTGTGLVPELDFTLRPGDQVRIEIAQLGVLTNRVASIDEFGWLIPDPLRAPDDGSARTKEER